MDGHRMKVEKAMYDLRASATGACLVALEVRARAPSNAKMFVRVTTSPPAAHRVAYDWPIKSVPGLDLQRSPASIAPLRCALK
jgi:hypothetical protein